MSLLKQVIEEMAAGGSTGAGAVAAVPGGLFKGGAHYNPYKKWAKEKKGNVLRRVKRLGRAKIGMYGESLGLTTDETNFNPADVVSKLDAAEKKVKAEEDTVSFGLEDDEGNLVRVYVRAEQAREFEAALAAMLGDADENDDDVNSSLEIAEVLFDLKNKFEIVDVNWGDIPADEEEEQEVEGGEEGDMTADMQSPDGEMGAEGGEMGDEMGAEGGEMGMDGGMGGEDEAMKSTLQQVIDMLKSNAEAQKAEAEARKAEAKAKEAEYAAKAADSKIRQEEQVLDMETYYKNKQTADKEAKKLAKLAKFKHDQAQDAESTLSSDMSFESVEHKDVEFWQEEEEEDKVLTPDELAHMIFYHLRANK